MKSMKVYSLFTDGEYKTTVSNLAKARLYMSLTYNLSSRESEVVQINDTEFKVGVVTNKGMALDTVQDWTVKTVDLGDVRLQGLSADALLGLARRAKELAGALREEQPSKELALLNGVVDRSYNTVSNGWVPSYSGTAIIEMEDGSRWRAIGHPPKGNAYIINKRGWIEFIKVAA